MMLLTQILGTSRTIAMENPTYRQAYRVFESLGCQMKPVEMDAHGMNVRLLEESGGGYRLRDAVPPVIPWVL